MGKLIDEKDKKLSKIMWDINKITDFKPDREIGDISGLKKSIEKYGLLHSITIDKDGKLIAGRRRLKACKEIGWKEIPVKIVDRDLESDKIAISIHENTHRKALTDIETVLKLEEYEAVVAEERGLAKHGGDRKSSAGPALDFLTAGETAEVFDTSEATIRNVRKIAKTIKTDKGKVDDELSKLSGDALLEVSKSSKPEEIKKKIKKKVKKGKIPTKKEVKEMVKVQKAKEILKEEAKEIKKRVITPNIKHSDYKEHLKTMKDKSVDLLITDPLYMPDVPDIKKYVEEWVDPVLKKLSDAGQAYIFTGAYFEELVAYMEQLNKDEGVRFTKQLLVWEYRNTIGPMTKTKYKQNWQAIFYLRGPNAPELNTDQLVELFAVQRFNAPDARQGLKHHTWEKPLDLIRQLIRHGSKIGDLVFDPFTGTGTMLLAASELGRDNIGTEINEKMVKIALERGCVLKK